LKLRWVQRSPSEPVPGLGGVFIPLQVVRPWCLEGLELQFWT